MVGGLTSYPSTSPKLCPQIYTSTYGVVVVEKSTLYPSLSTSDSYSQRNTCVICEGTVGWGSTVYPYSSSFQLCSQKIYMFLPWGGSGWVSILYPSLSLHLCSQINIHISFGGADAWGSTTYLSPYELCSQTNIHIAFGVVMFMGSILHLHFLLNYVYRKIKASSFRVVVVGQSIP